MSVELALVLLWAALTLGAWMLARSDPSGGRSISVFIPAAGGVQALGAWLVKLGYPYIGGSLTVLVFVAWIVVFASMDRAERRRFIPIALVFGAVMVVLALVLVADSVGPSHPHRTLVILLVAATILLFLFSLVLALVAQSGSKGVRQ